MDTIENSFESHIFHIIKSQNDASIMTSLSIAVLQQFMNFLAAR
jgi:hypothetical protein